MNVVRRTAVGHCNNCGCNTNAYNTPPSCHGTAVEESCASSSSQQSGNQRHLSSSRCPPLSLQQICIKFTILTLNLRKMGQNLSYKLISEMMLKKSLIL